MAARNPFKKAAEGAKGGVSSHPKNVPAPKKVPDNRGPMKFDANKMADLHENIWGKPLNLGITINWGGDK